MAKSDFSYHYALQVRYAETDAQGIVYFSNYLMYCDTAHTEYLRELPHNYTTEFIEQDLDFHVVKSLVDYKAFSRFDDPLEIYVRIARFGRTSKTVQFELYQENSEILIASAEFILVLMNTKTSKPTPWPESFKKKVYAHEVIAPSTR